MDFSLSPSLSPCRSSVLRATRANLSVMMPLDSVTMNNAVNRRKAMNTSLQALKSAGVEGIMMDMWWVLVEREAAGLYNWGRYGSVEIGGLLMLPMMVSLKIADLAWMWCDVGGVDLVALWSII
ncbi:beta-amylase 1 [Quercus suber]|uniref:Beta-amylase n=1 Tax=Quercus suber TaxID=58331 RepID=A0AAW0KV28_QUESU